MAMLEYNEAVERKFIIVNGEPYEVISSHVFRKQQRKPVNATKLKNLFTGKVTEISFHQSEKIEEAEIQTRKVKFLYQSREEYWFCEEADAGKRFKMTRDLIGGKIDYIKPNTVLDLMTFDERNIGFRFPITVELKVKESAPAVAGDTVKGGTKVAVLETGKEIQVPMFVNEGDTIKINTETGEYRERV
ncbi:MAG: elongation factor P [bacterium]|nr:elongation factor P [bacterium]